MSFITSSFWRTPSADPKTELVAAPAVARPAMDENRTVYFRNEKGWKSYEIQHLTEAQCEAVHKECLADASFERNRALAETVGAVLLTVGIAVAAIAVAKLASLFFMVSMVKIAAHFGGAAAPLAFFGVKVFTHLATYLATGMILEKLWSAFHTSITDQWQAAKHYDDLRGKALMRQIDLKYAPVEQVVAPPVLEPTHLEEQEPLQE